MKQADTAMYQAKQNGRNNYQVFSQDVVVSPTIAVDQSVQERAFPAGN
jgi:hypothetical protein